MALSPDEIQRISAKVGFEVATLPGVRDLMDRIKKKTNVRLGRNTLKRLFGLDTSPVNARKSTLNVIAVAIGYPDWNSFLEDKPTIEEDFYPGMVSTYDMTQIKKGVRVGIAWDPDRSILLLHLGQGLYQVIQSENGKLRKDDLLTLGKLTIGLPFAALSVMRSEKNIGPYNAAARSAIEEILFFPNK